MKNKQFSKYRVIEGVGFSQTINLLFFLGILLESFCGSVEIETNVIKMSIIDTFENLLSTVEISILGHPLDNSTRQFIAVLFLAVSIVPFCTLEEYIEVMILVALTLYNIPAESTIEHKQMNDFILILEHLINSKNPPIGLAEDIKRFFEKGQEIYHIEGITTSYKYIIHIMEYKPELFPVICEKVNSSTSKLNFSIILNAYEKAYGIKDYNNIPL